MVIVECVVAVAKVPVAPKLFVEKGLVVVELATRVEYVVEAQKMVAALGLYVGEDLEVGESTRIAECVRMASKVFVVLELPVETRFFLVEQVESIIILAEKMSEGLEPVVNVGYVGGH